MMPVSSRARRRCREFIASLGLGLLVIVGPGCGLFGGTTVVDVNVFATHHPRRGTDGLFPEYGFDEAPRTWTNDQGWEVNLLEGYIVITGATLVDCDGGEFPIELPFGPLPEFINARDLDVVNFGRVNVPEGRYCELDVDYGPYVAADAAAAPNTAHSIASDRDLEGLTVFLGGSAVRDDEVVNFTLSSTEPGSVRLPLRSPDGSPTEIEILSDVGTYKITVGKTYDRFFDGIDFTNFETERDQLNAGLLPLLLEESRAYRGTNIY